MKESFNDFLVCTYVPEDAGDGISDLLNPRSNFVKLTVAVANGVYEVEDTVYLMPEMRDSNALRRYITLNNKQFVVISKNDVVLRAS